MAMTVDNNMVTDARNRTRIWGWLSYLLNSEGTFNSILDIFYVEADIIFHSGQLDKFKLQIVIDSQILKRLIIGDGLVCITCKTAKSWVNSPSLQRT